MVYYKSLCLELDSQNEWQSEMTIVAKSILQNMYKTILYLMDVSHGCLQGLYAFMPTDMKELNKQNKLWKICFSEPKIWGGTKKTNNFDENSLCFWQKVVLTETKFDWECDNEWRYPTAAK